MVGGEYDKELESWIDSLERPITSNLDTNLNLIAIDWEDYHANATLFALNDYGDYSIFAHWIS